MEKKITLIVIATLVVGVIVGYCVGLNSTDKPPATIGMHQVPNESLMGNGMGMHGMMMNMNAALSGKTGDEFDKAFLSEMIVHHEGAVDMAQAALQSAKRPEIKSLANDIISAQTKEINQMRAWLKSWYNQ